MNIFDLLSQYGWDVRYISDGITAEKGKRGVWEKTPEELLHRLRRRGWIPSEGE